MIYDLNKLENNDAFKDQFDICIIGAGAAGITLAVNLSDFGFKIALCEAGGDEYNEKSQNNYKGTVIGDNYFELDIARLRFLGGSTNHWNGMCRPFSEIDFKRNYLGNEYMWPITYDDILKYQKQACKILEIDDDFEFNNQKEEKIKKIKFQFSPPVRFKDKYIKKLINSKNIFLFLNSNLKDIFGDKNFIKGASFESYNKREMTIQAKKFIFAMGGIENSRYLLWFSKKYKSKFFDSNAPIGKYWMEHPHYTLGSAIVEKKILENNFYTLRDDKQIDLGILNCGFRINEVSNQASQSLIKEILCIAPKLGQKISSMANKGLVCGARFFAAWEQEPNISNCITLSNKFNDFGIPKINLNWKKSNFDKFTIQESVKIFSNWLLEKDLGRLHLQSWLINNENYPENDELAGYHHMGGTRMSSSKKYGVVDKNCKVFGSNNLYIAGSSIFTTGGHNNPTLPIIQFSLRLAEHLIKTKDKV